MASIRRKKFFLIALLVVVLSSSNLLVLLFFHLGFLSIRDAEAIQLAKDVTCLMILLIFALPRVGNIVRLSSSIIIFSFLLVVIGFFAFLLSQRNFQAALNFRRYMTPIEVLTIGYLLAPSEAEWNRAVRLLVGLGVVAGIASIIDFGFLGVAFWKSLGYFEYLVKVKHDIYANAYTGQLFGNFQRPVGRILVFRSGSIFGDPLSAGENLGFISVLAFLYASAKKTASSGAAFLLAATGLLLTFTREGYLLLVITLLLYAIREKRGSLFWAVLIVGVLALILPDVSRVLQATASLSESSAQIHASSITDFFNYLFSFHGGGVGQSFSFSPYEGGEGTEWFILLATGLLGLIVFYGFLFTLVRQFSLLDRRLPDENMLKVWVPLISTAIILSFVSQNMLTMTGFGIFWLYAGMAISVCSKSSRRFSPNSHAFASIS